MSDTFQEDVVVGALLMHPEYLALVPQLTIEHFTHPLRRPVFAVMRDFEAKGLQHDLDGVAADIARQLRERGSNEREVDEHVAEHVIKLADAVAKSEATTPGYARERLPVLAIALERMRLDTEVKLAVAEAGEREDDEITDLALRDVDLAAPSEPRARWIVPLDSFLGGEEPSDDDREEWNIRDLIPRGEALLWAGPPKSGKTWAMLDVAIAAALGQPWLSHENCAGGPVRVLVLAFEDSLRRLRKRVWELMRGRGLTPNDATLREHLAISREPLRLPTNELAFAAEIKRWKPSIVLIDNLTRVMEGDPNTTKDAARFGNMWTKLCGDVGACCGFLHHTTKVGPTTYGSRGEGDPFELVKGNGDFVAVARHVVLMRPIDAPDEKIADVRMRGNLDIRREDFVLGFERAESEGHWTARLGDRGTGDDVRSQLATDRKAKNDAKKKAEIAAELERRTCLALEIMRRDGACSQVQLAAAAGVESPRTVAPVFANLVATGVARLDKRRGYVFADSGAS